MRRIQDRVELPLPDQINRGCAREQCAVGKIMRIAIPVLRRHGSQQPILGGKLDEIAALWRGPEHVSDHKIVDSALALGSPRRH